VERNLEIIPRDRLGAVVLEDGDSVEVLRFVGGG
jgi:thiamine biosynthesis protein ThiS